MSRSFCSTVVFMSVTHFLSNIFISWLQDEENKKMMDEIRNLSYKKAIIKIIERVENDKFLNMREKKIKKYQTLKRKMKKIV